MYTVSFSFEEDRVYTTQPMSANQTIAFMADANNQGFYITEVQELMRKRMIV